MVGRRVPHPGLVDVTIDEILEGVLEREGPGVPPEYVDRDDKGGRTAWGISERAHPAAWRSGPPSREDAKAIYLRKYVAPFTPLGNIGMDERVRVALIDDAVHSGVETAIRALQRVLEVEEDGIIGPQTIAAAIKANGDGQWLLTRLVQARAHRLTRLVQRDPSQLRFLTGWIDRALGMLG